MEQMIYRNLQEDEAQKFWKMMYQLDFETKFMMYEPGEREQTEQDMEQIKSKIRDAAAGRDFLLIAEADGQIEGYRIKRLELTVLCGNEAAKRLYESNGFVVEGVRVKSMFVDGRYEDEFYMAKIF